MKDQEYEDLRSMVFRKFLKTIQIGENSFQIPMHFKKEERLKNNEKLQNSHLGYYPMRMSHVPQSMRHSAFVRVKC